MPSLLDHGYALDLATDHDENAVFSLLSSDEAKRRSVLLFEHSRLVNSTPYGA